MRSRFAGILLASLVLVALAGCGDSPTDGGGNPPPDNGGTPPDLEADTVRFTARADTLSPAEAAAFTAVAVTSAGEALAGKAFTWTSSDPGVATVSAEGLVTAVAPGSATITASVDGKDATATLAVVRTWRAISVGNRDPDAVCGLTLDDRAWCWGANDAGQFGTGATGSQAVTPTAAAGGLTWRQLSAGYHYVCGITTDDRSLCWGQLGKNPLSGQQLTPAPIDGAPAFATVEAGDLHGCGITDAGAAWCWGRNQYGALGNGTVSLMESAVPVAGGHTWKTVQPKGLDYTCGLTTAGAAYCWGIGFLGIVPPPISDSVPHAVDGGHTFTTLATWFNGACGLEADGRAWCWGQNTSGTVGSGNGSDANVPTAVAGGLQFVQLAGTDTQMCGLTAAGQAYCWGSGAAGQLGGATPPDCGGRCSYTPVAVQGGHVFTALAAGAGKTCGVTTGGAAWCWGQGPLGNGTMESSAVPVRVGHPAGAPAS